MLYFTGWHNLNNGISGTKNIDYLMVSYNRLCRRKSIFPLKEWIIDSGFSILLQGGNYASTRKYAKVIAEWADKGILIGASCQDYPVFDKFLSLTTLNVKKHQQITLKRYKSIKKYVHEECEKKGKKTPYIIPILQGKSVSEYLEHLSMYGDEIQDGDLVGIGSLKYQKVSYITTVLCAIKLVRPSLKLHGFGLTKKQITPDIKGLLYSADSTAAAFVRDEGLPKYFNSNNPDNAITYSNSIESIPTQISIFEYL